MIADHHKKKQEYGGIKILLVEDNPGDVGLVEAALEESGDPSLELHVEQRLYPALSRLSKEHFSVVLLDLNLPDSKGFDTVASVQSTVPRVPIVIMTGYADEQFARSAINSGVQDYLIKDNVHPGSLVRSIYFAIDRKQIENDLHALERLASAASSSLDLDSLINLILNALMEEIGAQKAGLILKMDGERTINKSVGDEHGCKSVEYLELERELVNEVLKTNGSSFYQMKGPDGAITRTMLKVPMNAGSGTRGVVEVEWLSTHPESSREISLLRVAADKMAAGIANANAYESVKRSERMAEEERLRLRTIIDNLPVGILIVDANGRELESNSYRDIIWRGRPSPSKNIQDLCKMKAWWAETSEPVLECPVVKALKYNQTTLGAMIDIERIDGTRGTILSSAAPITNRIGETIGAIALQQDITEQVRLERELAEAKGRAEFYIDLLTHDIDNSLASVSGYLQLIESSGNLNERAERWLMGATTSLQEPLDLITTVRKVQKSRTMAMERSSIDLNSVLGEVVTNAQQKNDERADIHLSLVENAKVVGTDLLRDLFSNLIGNAIKHSSGRVRVDVDVRPLTLQNQEFYRIDITDTGKGIPDSLKDRLFTKGVRGVSKAPGQGLGLFLSQNIVAGAGGRIWVEDRVPGDHTKGARFVVLLPRSE